MTIFIENLASFFKFLNWTSLDSNIDEVLKPATHLPKGSTILGHHKYF